LVMALLITGPATGEPHPLATPSMAGFLGWAGRADTEGPAGIALLPARASLDVALAQSPLAMARALPFALLSLAAHYLWAARSAYAFEDASVHAAERRARSLDALRSGQSRWIARTPAPFTLGGTGRPEVALLWRSGIAALRVLSLRFIILVSVVIAVSLFAAMSAFSEGDGGMASAIAFTAIAAAVVAALLGPQSLQLDLRMDRDRMDVLRSWPLPGWRIVAGSIAGPAILLGGSVVAMVWFAWVTAVFGGLVHGTWPLAAVVTAALVGPAIATCGLVVNTGWAVAFPTWSATDSRAGGGFEAFGQRLLLMLSSVAVVGIALVPALVVGAPIWLLGSGVTFALPLAAAVGAAILLVEAFLGILLIGRLFDRFEPVIT
jgi:ABC-2 type transport system permease protein